MRKLRYHLVDVFTERAFGGNQLAVCTDGRDLSSELMQAIAKEFNLSETTFVLPPEDSSNNYRVRIFTPGSELPMAGHPTVGTSFILARERMIEVSGDETTIRLEEGVGTIPVQLNFKDGQPDLIWMQQLLPTFGPRLEDVRGVAEMLSITPDDIEESLPIEVVSCGVPFLYVPLKSLQAARSIRFRLDVWEKLLGNLGVSEVFVFTKETALEGSSVHSRMFAPALGIREDPATGAASGPLGCYLVRHKVLPTSQRSEFTSEQGIEMGRPSIIKIIIEQEAGEISRVRIGGRCVFIGEGHLEIE
ncbi:MAG: trans-2,3-dihydro-3-hydroxyanthranilate isomerase [Acidobacteriota bacterium]|jgi:trans-2,3-dihydro-3-hydroxyanthranilate isomerase|nr:trans-2,3-dihydro-3-hydroxyanthranilate isomerase [Acidobacteriota bacterium]